MNPTHTNPSSLEPVNPQHHSLLSWKAVFAGVLISVMSYMILTALGAGIGGLTASNLISNEESGSGLATGAGLWLGISAVISLFLGSYFTLRVSNFLTNKVGAAHGFVVASIFFVLMIWGAGSAIGSFSKGLGKLVGVVGSSAASLAASPAVQDSVQKALGDSTLKSSPESVAQGLAIRLLQGDSESAKSYYAYQTGMSEEEVNTKFAQLKTDFDQKVKIVGERTANAVADAGWSLFVTFLVGLVAAVMGGRTGAHANNERPVAKMAPGIFQQNEMLANI